jgi:hypothetical protein
MVSRQSDKDDEFKSSHQRHYSLQKQTEMIKTTTNHYERFSGPELAEAVPH